jgi:membrane protease YdiL (CAAX protease family)
MTEPSPPTKIDYESKPPPPSAATHWWQVLVRWLKRDDVAYAAPMLVFLAFTQLGVSYKNFYPASYVAKVVIVPILLWFYWRHYTKIRWNYWWLGVVVGVVGIFQWVPMQLWLQKNVAHFGPAYVCATHPEVTHKGPSTCVVCKAELVPDVFNPFKRFSATRVAWAFIIVRMIGAVLVVPVMEELFWRDFLWREIISPNDFKLAEVGEFEWPAVLIVAGAFALVHGNWWLTSIVWGLMVAGLLVYTKSLGACIIAHATTNLLLALYVLKTQDWAFW